MADRRKRRTQSRGLTPGMQKKLVVLFIVVLLAFGFLIYRLYHISRDNGAEYEKTVLSQQSYDSRELPYKRGTITDAKGTVLATSELVYNVIIDAYQMNSGTIDETTGESIYVEPTLNACESLGIDKEKIRTYITDNPDSRYYVALKNLSYSQYTAYQQAITDASDKVKNIQASLDEENAKSNPDENTVKQLEDQLAEAKKDNEEYQNIQGIWFEPAYIRSYPNGSLACDVIGFANDQNQGSFGLEEYYNDTLNGTPGREYGYLSGQSTLQRTTIEATDGNNLVLTLDANIQSICEKYLLQYNEEKQNKVRQGYGANNVGVIIEDVTNGDILAMASYPNYDLSNPYDLSRIVGMPKLDDKDNPTDEYMTQADVDALDTFEEQSRYLNALWTNFCISTPYEPGSTAKPFTYAAGLESGKMTGDETYYCGGSLDVGGWDIYCHNRSGDGILTDNEAIERSCNVALMQMAEQIGVEDFTKFQRIFGFGLRTNIDLAGEARTDSMVISADDMSVSDLATNSFGQNFDVTMIQMISAFSSLINGGYYWQPHLVSRIASASGATVQNIEPRLVKQTVSETTSEKIREATLQVVEGANGTGKKARPAGYRIGGKTGTAETLPRGNKEYIVSFEAYAPYEDPKIAIYVVIDRMNDAPEDQTSDACLLVREILTEVLPYLNISMTVPLTSEEEAELEALNLQNTYAYGSSNTPIAIKNNFDSDGDGVNDAVDANGDGAADTALDTNGDGVTDAVDTDGDGKADMWDTDNDGVADSTTDPNAGNSGSESSDTASSGDTQDKPWLSYEYDETTGYYIDPETGGYIDPETGYSVGSSLMQGSTAASSGSSDSTDAASTTASSGSSDAAAASSGTSAAGATADTGTQQTQDATADTAASSTASSTGTGTSTSDTGVVVTHSTSAAQ